VIPLFSRPIAVVKTYGGLEKIGPMSKVAGRGHQATTPSHALPHHLTTFVGREAELRSLKQLLRNSRMVTLTGTGGAGKSRLAAEVARQAGGMGPDGGWWVELAAGSDGAAALVATLAHLSSDPASRCSKTPRRSTRYARAWIDCLSPSRWLRRGST